jgi:hypothetical protein
MGVEVAADVGTDVAADVGADVAADVGADVGADVDVGVEVFAAVAVGVSVGGICSSRKAVGDCNAIFDQPRIVTNAMTRIADSLRLICCS